MAPPAVVQEWDAQGRPIQPTPASTTAPTEWDASGKPIMAAPTPPVPTPPGWSVSSVLHGTDPAHQAIDKAAQTEPLNTDSLGGFVHSVANNLGAGAVRVFSPLAHPVDTALSLANPTGAGYKFGQAVAQNPSGEAVAAIPQAALALVGAGGDAAAATRDTAAAVKAKIYPTSQSLAADTSAARNLSKALVVSPTAAPNFIRAATDEAGTVVGYAKDNNLPINSKVDFANAADAAAKAVQSHFDALLEPSAKEIVAVPRSYQGPTVGEGPNATLAAVNARIDAISSELKSNFRKPLAAQTSAANTSDADLIAEKNALTGILHDKLAAATGLQPADIAAVRQQAGKLRTIADEANLSANTDATAAGKQAMGGTTSSAIGTKMGLLDRLVLQPVQGGPEIIGNREILNALQKVKPKPLNLPQASPPAAVVAAPRIPISGGPSTVVPGPDYTPDPGAADILRARIQGRLKPKTSPSPMN